MASIPQTPNTNDLNGKAGAPSDAPANAQPDSRTATEKESDSFLDRETAGMEAYLDELTDRSPFRQRQESD